MVEKVLARGIPASSGTASGAVKVVTSVKELFKVRNGDILVVKLSNPAWTAGMMKASGFVSELGGIISHTAIVAREMGIPCIVSVKDATSIFKDGMEIIMDGNKGVIYEQK